MLHASLGSVELDKEEEMQVNGSSNYVFIACVNLEVADFFTFCD